MAGLFGGGVKMPPPPKVVRMPVENDESQRMAALRYKEAARRRKGREASMLTAMTQETVGSSGQKLGA